jgi:tRNA pseudouridine32 synthase/23S rRNA pseudouridine746 synthase
MLIHADDALLVLDKPAGLLAVPGRGADKQDCLSARVQRIYPDAQIVHRLDMGTSGLLVMGRGAAAQRALSQAFAARQPEKRYEAMVWGALAVPGHASGWGEIALPLIPDWPNRPLSKVDHAAGKPSLTRWRVLGHTTSPTGEPLTRVELEPVTGRTHQLRVHLQAIGHPILGDALYAPAEIQALAPRLLLHATRLRLPHPATGEWLAFESPVPF